MQLTLNIDWDKVRLKHLQVELDKVKEELLNYKRSVRSYKGHKTRRNK